MTAIFLATIPGLASAETYLHRDLGGVTTYVGNVRLSVRRSQAAQWR